MLANSSTSQERLHHLQTVVVLLRWLRASLRMMECGVTFFCQLQSYFSQSFMVYELCLWMYSALMANLTVMRAVTPVCRLRCFFVKLGVGGSFRNFILKHADDAHQSLHIRRSVHLWCAAPLCCETEVSNGIAGFLGDSCTNSEFKW